MLEKEETPAPGTYYTVKKGESLWSIARKFDTTTAELTGLNDLGSNKLNVGDKLLISGDGIARSGARSETAEKDTKANKAEPAPVKLAKINKVPEPLIEKTGTPG